MANKTETPKEGYINDYVSGLSVKATPEEIEAVQVFSKQLVEDYNYPKDHIRTRPQFRVKRVPSDTKKEYPVDIAVFSNNKKHEDDVYIIVECKRKNRKDGRTQLEDYLTFSKAVLGVWFNGNEKLYLRKIIEKNGRIHFEEIPSIPWFKQRIEDIGRFKRKKLKPTHNLKANFKVIRNHLAANTIGATRDEILAQQLINLIFCKIYDEKFTEPEDIVEFRAGVNEKPENIKARILEIFEKVKKNSDDILDEKDDIILDENSVAYVVGELQNYCLTEAERDVIADAFETFIGDALKGPQGQFFTPRNVVKMMVEILDPDDKDLIIDPACGSGGFLIDALKHVWQKISEKGKVFNWKFAEVEKQKNNFASNFIIGVEKDYFLSKLTKAYMRLVGDGASGIFCGNSLKNLQNWKDWKEKIRSEISPGKFNVLLTNPPFGSKIPVSGEEILKQFELGYKWKQGKKRMNWEKGKLKEQEAPQILFIERCLQLLKNDGRMAIVLPDGIYGNSQLGYIRKFIMKRARIVAVIDVPKETFQPNTGTKTSILILQKTNNIPTDYPVFMCVAETCGHDRRGNQKGEDDISKIPDEFRKWAKENKFTF